MGCTCTWAGKLQDPLGWITSKGGPEGIEVRTHPFEPQFATLHAPVFLDGYPLAVVGRMKGYQMQKNSLISDQELATLFAGQFNNQYKPADISNVKALMESFGKFATREYDRKFVASALPRSLAALYDVLPVVDPHVLTPEETLGTIKGQKSSGYLCDGTKMNFISNYGIQLTEFLYEPTAALPCIPIQVLKPKEEIRDVTKPPRDLSFPPVWFMALTAMYEKDFFLCNMQQWTDSPIRVGIPMPQGWPLLVWGLTRYQNKNFMTWFFEWDASQYDRTHPIELTLMWFHILNYYYQFAKLFGEMGDEWFRLFYVMFWSCFRLVLLPDGRIVLVVAGIYSGDVSTTNKNSVFHIIRLALCWRHIFGNFNGFRNFVRTSGLSLFGDDGACAAHCEKHFYFLNNLHVAWEACFGALLKVYKSTSISGISFLGKRSLGDDHLTRTIPVSSDLERQICSLVHKTKAGQDPIQRLSKLVAHRELLVGYAYLPNARALDDVATLNKKGARLLDLVDAAIKLHIARYESYHRGNPEWVGLLVAANTPPKEVVARFLAGRDTLTPEADNLKVHSHSSHANPRLLSTTQTWGFAAGEFKNYMVKNVRNQRRTEPKARSKEVQIEVRAAKPARQAARASAPRQGPRKNPGTGNVVGQIAGAAASSIPVVGPALAPLASALAGGLTNLVSSGSWSGNGAVKVAENSLVRNGQMVEILDGADGATYFKYREVLGTIVASSTPGGFAKQTFRVNPADSETFNWLGDQGDKYAEYQLLGMWGELDPQTSMVAPDGGSSLGRWGMAAQYNPALQDGYGTLEQCLQADGGQNGVVTDKIRWAAECKPKDTVTKTGLYTSAGAPPEGMNYAQTDPFVLVVFENGVEEADAVLGICVLYYHFKMMKKTLTPSSTSNIADIFHGTTDVQEGAPFGVEIINCATNTIGGTLENSLVIDGSESGAVYTFPRDVTRGRFLFLILQSQAGSSGSYATGTLNLFVENCTIAPDVLSPITDFTASRLLDASDGSIAGPSTGLGTGTVPTGTGISSGGTFFVDITRGGASVSVVWNGVNATAMPADAWLLVTAFPAAVTFSPPDSELNKIVFRNGPTINRLAAALESTTDPKKIARIVRAMRSALSQKGKMFSDKALLTNIHKKEHRDLLVKYDFGRVREDDDLRKQVNLLTLALAGQTQQKPALDEALVAWLRDPHNRPPWSAAPSEHVDPNAFVSASHSPWNPIQGSPELAERPGGLISHHPSDSENDEKEDQIEFLRLKLEAARRKSKAQKAALLEMKAKSPKPAKQSMSYAISAQRVESPNDPDNITAVDLHPEGVLRDIVPLGAGNWSKTVADP